MHSFPKFTVVHFEGNLLEWWQFLGGIVQGAIFLRAIILVDIFPVGNYPGAIIQGEIIQGQLYGGQFYSGSIVLEPLYTNVIIGKNE